VEIATYYKDNYHAGNPAIVNAEVNWTVNSTPLKSGDMELTIVIYEGLIILPDEGIGPGVYNITSKAHAPEFQFTSTNITLNVLPKHNTTIWLTNHTSTEIRVGRDVVIAAEIEFSNHSLNRTGITLSEISWINVSVFYEGTPQIHSNFSNNKFIILGKYETNLTIDDNELDSVLISGEEVSINITLYYNDSGTWRAFAYESIDITLDYSGYGEESSVITTDHRGRAVLTFTPIEQSDFLNISASYSGNSSYQYAIDYSKNFTIAKHNVSLQLFDFNPLEIYVGNPLILYCQLIYTETGLPIVNATVNFFVYLGDSDIRIYTQSAVTNGEGIATTALLILEPFEMLPFLTVGVEYEGDASTATATSTSSFPTIPMTTTKFITNYLDDNWWWMTIIVGAVVGASLAYRYGVVLPRRRRLIELQKKIAARVKDAQNMKYAMIVHKESGTSIFGQGFGVELDSDLISGFLTAISAFQTEIGVKGKKKEETGGFELNYADFKILLSDGELSRFAFILQERASDTFRQTAHETVEQFEKEYGSHLTDWGGALKPFRTAHRLLERNFETGLSQALRVKSLDKKEMKHLSDLSQALVRIAHSQQEKGGGKFVIENIMQVAVQARKEEEYEIYYEIYNLYKNRIFRPASMSDTEIDVEDIKTSVTPVVKAPKVSETEETKAEQELIKGIFVPNLKTEEYEKLRNEIDSMSPTNQKLLIKKLMFTPDDKRTKIVKDLLKEREKLKKQLNENSSIMEKLLEKDPPAFAEIYHIMEMDKRIYEQLGNEEKASILAVDIQQVLQKFDNVKEIKELRLYASSLAKDAKEANQKQEFLKAALLYRRAARIYVELGNMEDAEKLIEIANYSEQKVEG